MEQNQNIISEAIKEAYRQWKAAEDNIPEYEYQKGYKGRKAKSNKLWKAFSELCETAGLKPVQVSMDLLAEEGGNIFRING
jgi:hypothetical protein